MTNVFQMKENTQPGVGVSEAAVLIYSLAFLQCTLIQLQAGEPVKTKVNESVHVTLSTVAALCLCKTWRYCNSSQNADKSSGRNFNSTLDLNIWNIMNEGEHLESRMQLLLFL